MSSTIKNKPPAAASRPRFVRPPRNSAAAPAIVSQRGRTPRVAGHHFEGLIAPQDGSPRHPTNSEPPPEIEPGAGDHQLSVLRRADVCAVAEILAVTTRHDDMVTGLFQVWFQLPEECQDLTDARALVGDREGDFPIGSHSGARQRRHGLGEAC